MTLTEVPYGMSSPFHSGPPVNLSGAGTNMATANPCNRACLDKLVEQVLQAMLAHDASRLPLAKGVRYSENGQFISIGDGLWGTAGKIEMPGAGEYAAHLADPSTGTAGYWGVTNENGTTGVLALRIKTSGGKISEIEAIDVREEANGSRGGTVTLMRPPLPVEFKAAALGSLDSAFRAQKAENTGNIRTLMAAYFDGLERHTGDDVRCVRRDNAALQSPGCAASKAIYNHTTIVRDRRILRCRR